MAMSYVIERPLDRVARREQVVDIVISRMQLSENYFSGIRNRLPRYYDLWRGVWTGRFHPHKNNIHIPLIYSAIWADAARKVSTSLSGWPYVNFVGYGPDDAAIARRQENLLSAQLDDMGFFMKEIDTFVTADLYGTSISQLTWLRDQPIHVIEELIDSPLSGEMLRIAHKGRVTLFDGPMDEPVDRLDAYPQPGIPRLENMDWFIRRRFIDLDQVRMLAQRGVFDKAEVARLEMEGGVNAGMVTDLASVKRFQIRLGMDDETSKWMDKYTRPVEILEMWGKVPSELAPDGVTERLITIANRRYVMRNRPNPHHNQMKPFFCFSPTPDPHYFDGPSKAEVIEKVQIVANRYINQSLDAADLIIDPVWFYDKASNLRTNNLFLRPGRFIPMDGNPNEMVMPMQANLSGLAVADQKVEQMRNFAQMGSGMIEDAVQGMEGPDRQTAREFLGRREAAGTRLMLESLIYERMRLEPFANGIVCMNKQFLTAPVMINILGDSASRDPITGLPIPSTRETLTDYDLMQTYTARAMGSTYSLSKSTRRNDLIQLITAMSATPEIFGAINSVNFWRGVFRDFDIQNINEIFIQQAPQNPLAQLVAQATGGQGGIQSVPTSGQMTQGQLPSAPGIPQGMDMKNMMRAA